jgi:hypothetical protein
MRSVQRFVNLLGVGCGLLATSCGDGVASLDEVPINAVKFHSSPWSEPVSLGPVVNSSAQDESPALSPNGLVLFFSSRRVAANQTDVYVTRRESKNSPWQAPVPVTALNTAFTEAVASLSEDGHYIFFGSNRPGGQGAADIYFSYRDDVCDDQAWGPVVGVAAGINTAAAEGGPFFRTRLDSRGNLYFNRGPNPQTSDFYVAEIELPSGAMIRGPEPVTELNSALSENTLKARSDLKEVVFSRNPGGNADLYASTRKHWKDEWSPPELITELTTLVNEFQPTLSHNGRIMVFARGASVNEMDLYLTTRGHGSDDDDGDSSVGCWRNDD